MAQAKLPLRTDCQQQQDCMIGMLRAHGSSSRGISEVPSSLPGFKSTTGRRAASSRISRREFHPAESFFYGRILSLYVTRKLTGDIVPLTNREERPQPRKIYRDRQDTVARARVTRRRLPLALPLCLAKFPPGVVSAPRKKPADTTPAQLSIISRRLRATPVAADAICPLTRIALPEEKSGIESKSEVSYMENMKRNSLGLFLFLSPPSSSSPSLFFSG